MENNIIVEALLSSIRQCDTPVLKPPCSPLVLCQKPYFRLLALGGHPGMKRIHQRRCFFLTYSSSDVRF